MHLFERIRSLGQNGPIQRALMDLETALPGESGVLIEKVRRAGDQIAGLVLGLGPILHIDSNIVMPSKNARMSLDFLGHGVSLPTH